MGKPPCFGKTSAVFPHYVYALRFSSSFFFMAFQCHISSFSLCTCKKSLLFLHNSKKNANFALELRVNW